MKIAILSDVHGNMPALNAVVSELRNDQFESIIVAGDLIGGPKPNETIRLLRSLNCNLIAGNMDLDLVKYARGKAPKEWYTIKQYGLMRWNNENILPAHIDFLESLPEQLIIHFTNAPSIKVVHGSPRSPYESIFPDRKLDVMRIALQQTEENVLVCGHIHVPWKKRLNEKLIINPGAVSAPLDRSVGAQYCVMEFKDDDWVVDHRIVKYDISQVRKDYKESGLLEAGTGIALAFLLACETGIDYGKRFIDFAFELAKDSGYQDIPYVPDGIWDQAIASFQWEESG